MKVQVNHSSITTAERLLNVAAELLREHGSHALTTRQVCDQAGIKAPTLYHHFGDKQGLLGALATRELQAFFAQKRALPPSGDALADLMGGWDDWIGFARTQPQLVAALRQGQASTVALRQAAEHIVIERLHRLPPSLPLRVPVDAAARVLVAGANTVVQLLLDGVQADELDRTNELLKTAILSAVLDGPGSP